jgi:hypothetical protein
MSRKALLGREKGPDPYGQVGLGFKGAEFYLEVQPLFNIDEVA